MADPRSSFYDGRPYAWLVDPRLADLRATLAVMVEPGLRVLDVCCGTGALARDLAQRGCQVVGLDLSPAQIAQAQRSPMPTSGQVRFVVADAGDLSQFSDDHFQRATVVMGLHEMPHQSRLRVLSEMLRVAEQVLIIDYGAPLPRHSKGLILRSVEFLAGPKHFSGFRDFLARGGLKGLLEEVGGRIEYERRLDRGCFHMVQCSRP